MKANNYTLHHGDCLQVMAGMDAGSVDLIATDLPYGTTACAWDTIIPFAPMWEQVKRVLKPGGVFLTTASQPFTSALVMSNPKWFKYEWIWDKAYPVGHGIAKYMPMKQHENILIFCEKKTEYYPQYEKLIYKDARVRHNGKMGGSKSGIFANGGLDAKLHKEDYKRQPKSIIKFYVPRKKGNHPTQKPVALYEYLIRTYSNPGETVLDLCMGSGTTGVAAIQTGRRFIGIEQDTGYFKIAEKRIAGAQPPLFTDALPTVTPAIQPPLFAP